MNRILALLILVIPGIIGGYGVKLMRDSVFGILVEPISYPWLQFLIGLIFFIAGIGFIAGFVFHRDRKRNKVQSRFQTVEPSETDIK